MKYKKQSHFENNPVLTKKNPHINSKKNAMKSEESPKEKTILSKKQKRQRQENSLDELTRAFIDYVKDTKKTEININDVVKKLKVKKRRIYDITNVLEGIGYIKKQAKNQVTWLKTEIFADQTNLSAPLPGPSISKEQKIEKLKKHEDKLTSLLLDSKNELTKLLSKPEFNYYKYLTFEDLKNISKNNDDVNLVAIKAPQGTKFDVPDPQFTKDIFEKTKEDARTGKEEVDPSLLETLSYEHQLFMESETGEIKVFVVLTKPEEEKQKNNNYLNSLDDISNYNLNTNFVGSNRRYSFSSTSSKILRNNFTDNNMLFNSLQQ